MLRAKRGRILTPQLGQWPRGRFLESLVCCFRRPNVNSPPWSQRHRNLANLWRVKVPQTLHAAEQRFSPTNCTTARRASGGGAQAGANRRKDSYGRYRIHGRMTAIGQIAISAYPATFALKGPC
jgi:hypothetical protein